MKYLFSQCSPGFTYTLFITSRSNCCPPEGLTLCYLLVFTEFSICKDLRIHIRSWSNCCLAMQLLWLHTKNIHFKRLTAIQNASFMLYIDICKCWKLNHNYWNKFKVPMFYSTVSGLFLFFSPEHWCVHKSSLNIRSVTIDDKLVNEGSLICVPCGMK